MKLRKTIFYISILVTLCVLIVLVTGSSILTMALDKDNSIPSGTFITWAGMISLPLALFTGIKEMRKPTSQFYSILSVCLKLTLLLAILWVPISYLLAGNISFSFTERASLQGGQQAMKWFWYLSFGIGIAAVSILFLHWMSLLYARLSSSKKNV